MGDDGVEEKGEGKSEIRTTALQLLTNDRRLDDGNVGGKKMERLQRMSKKNGIDGDFMKETFGANKDHNAELLQEIINKGNGVKRESVNGLFNGNNNGKVLQ